MTFVSVDGEEKRKISIIIQGHLLFQYIQDKKKRKQFENRMYLHSRLYLPCPSPFSSLPFYNQKLHRICFFNQKIQLVAVKPTSAPSGGRAAAVAREVNIVLARDPTPMGFLWRRVRCNRCWTRAASHPGRCVGHGQGELVGRVLPPRSLLSFPPPQRAPRPTPQKTEGN